MLCDGVQVGHQLRQVVCHGVHLIEPLILILHEGACAVVVSLRICVVEVFHEEVPEHQVALHALAGVLIVHQQGLLEQIHRIVFAPFFQRQRS